LAKPALRGVQEVYNYCKICREPQRQQTVNPFKTSGGK
jgi:hypothetical protein